MLDFLVGAGFIIGILVGLPILLWVTVAGWRSGHLSSRPGMIALGVILALGAMWLFWPKDAMKQLPALDSIISFGLLIVLAILAIMGKGGWPTKVALAVVALGFLLLGPTGFFSGYSDFQKGAKEVVLEGKPILSSASAPEHTPSVDLAAVENVVTLGQNQCTEPILLQNGWCISARGEEADVSAIRTEVLNMSTSAWELLPPGAFRKARYWRYCATEPNTKVFYSVYKKPSEGCNSNTR